MVSDVLFEAVERIREYQRGMPDIYDELRDQIDPVVDAMDRLRQILDTPPVPFEKAH